MSENLRNYTKAVYGMDHVIRAVDPDRWSAQSPCAGWTATDVSHHATGVLRWIESAARGGQPQSTGLGPAEEFASARDGVLEALDHPHVLQRSVPTPFGELSIDDLIGIVFVDCTVHAWDIARAVDGDTHLSPELVAAAHARVAALDQGLVRSEGFFGAPIPESAADDAQARFLKFVGRQP